MENDLRKIAWETPISPLTLENDEVHIWHVALNVSVENEQRLRSLLSEDELIRADRLRLDQHRRRFIVTRASLRQILSGYLSVSPVDLIFDYGPHGKPSLVLSEEKSLVNFNVAHSKDTALYAFSRERQLGIDIEFIRDKTDYIGISKNWFRTSELKKLKACSEDQRRRCFFRGWTRKEAYLKALGEGIAYGLDRFEVSLQAGDAALLWHQDDEQEVQRWELMEIFDDEKCSATVAVEGYDWRARYFRCSELIDRIS